MDVHTATELAYKNGYENGIRDAKVNAYWIISVDGYYPYCSNCKNEPKSKTISPFCPTCGAAMLNYNEIYGVNQ